MLYNVDEKRCIKEEMQKEQKGNQAEKKNDKDETRYSKYDWQLKKMEWDDTSVPLQMRDDAVRHKERLHQSCTIIQS